jgi:hypothetical protein
MNITADSAIILLKNLFLEMRYLPVLNVILQRQKSCFLAAAAILAEIPAVLICQQLRLLAAVVPGVQVEIAPAAVIKILSEPSF